MHDLDFDPEELPQPKRKSYRCIDRMCGAEDCETCHPGCTERLARERELEEDGD